MSRKMLHTLKKYCTVQRSEVAVRYYKPILISPTEELRKKIEKEAKEQDRKLGPAVCDVLRRYFLEKEKSA